MPVLNREDAVEVEELMGRIFRSPPERRAAGIRRLFVETLDFHPASGQVSLAGADGNARLPEAAERIAELDGFHVLFIPLPPSNSGRVRKAEVDAAARVLANQIGDDLLLVFTNPPASQLHIILPSFAGSRSTLRRMVVERDLPGRTAAGQVSNIYWNYQDSGSIRMALEQAFDVEPVTRDFFREYKRIFQAVEASVTGFQDDDGGLKERHSFVQTLFNRLMFVYFLSRKGWLTFNDDADYLNALWRDYGSLAGDNNFYAARLETLFFAGLNNPQSMDIGKDNAATLPVIGPVPFLNGGLFERNGLDKRKGVTVPDAAIEQILKGLFDRFNFTVMESTPFDIEVAVDPEMLGKVFEELVTGRHDIGAYYTPRPVVSFMCREALKGYLEGQDTGLPSGAIARFVDAHDTGGIQVAQARRLADALARVTVVDPACGSGAYLLGMMQELIELQTTLYNAGADAKSLYDLKLEIIQRNLYGVDIDDFAVNIAMLRLWLSLAIDYEGEKPKPLPNLDFKVVCGDSLLGPDPSANVEVQGALGQSVEQFRRLGRLKAEYMRASWGSDKERLKGQVEELNREIRETLGVSATDGVVDWRLEFGEIFVERKGFDIAIANPPYVRYQKIGTTLPNLRAAYNGKVAGNSDLYCYFYIRGLQLLKESGIHVFVCSNSWLDVAYGVALQDYLFKNSHVQFIYQSSVERQFSTALINTLISIIKKAPINEEQPTTFVSLNAEFGQATANPADRQEITLTKEQLKDLSQGQRFQGFKWGAKQLRLPDIYRTILNTALSRFLRIGDIATVKLGITTGANEFFYLDEEQITKFGIEEKYLQPVLTSPKDLANVSRSIAITPEQLPKRAFVCHDKIEDLKGTAAGEYIRWGEAQGYNKRPFCASRPVWYDLGHRERMPLAMNELIDTTAHIFLADGEILFDKNFDVIRGDSVDMTRLCVAMNSTLFQLAIHSSGRENFGGGAIRVATHELANLLVVNPSILPQVDASILNAVGWDVLSPSAGRWQIDGMVFDALGLTSGERGAVYEGVMELVWNRKQKAGSATGAPQGSSPWGQYADAVGRNVEARGKAIYEEKIRPEIDAEARHGHYVAIDVFSGDYEIDPHISAGARRLAERRPGIVGYKMRIGYPSVYNMDRPRKRVQ